MTTKRKGLSGRVARGMNRLRARAFNSPWLITPRAAPSAPSTFTSSSTWRLVAEPQVFCHPKTKARHYILDKLLAFHLAHGTDPARVLQDLEAALEHLPHTEYSAEAKILRKRQQALALGRGLEAQQLAALLPKVLAKLGASTVVSEKSGAPSPGTPKQA